MSKKVIGFFIVLIAFALSLAFLVKNETGSFSIISGYSISAEEQKDNSSIFGTIITSFLLLFVFMYIAKFIFDDYSRKTKPKEFKRAIDLDMHISRHNFK